MKFFLYWLIAMMSALLSIIEKFINGPDWTFWGIIAFSTFFILCSYGDIVENRGRDE